MRKTLVVLISVCIVLASVVSGATLQGTVYDFSLQPLEKVLVEVNSVPMQKLLVQGGKYSFQVPPGAYTITVKGGKLLSDVLAQEVAEVKGEGVFTIDIVTFPEIEVPGEENGIDVDLISLLEENNTSAMVGVLMLVLVVLAVGAGIVYWRRKINREGVVGERGNDESGVASLDRILEILKAEQGRMNQKDLRKRLPFSEAKLSLMVSELEAKGKIEKIKKGRGNILVLKETNAQEKKII